MLLQPQPLTGVVKPHKVKVKPANLSQSSRPSNHSIKNTSDGPESNNTTKKPKNRHYLAIKMGLTDEPLKPKRKLSPVRLGDGPPSQFPHYEQRTVNSMVDVSDHDNPILQKKHKRRRSQLIDSEIDVLKTLEARPQFKVSLLPKPELSTIPEIDSKAVRKKTHKRDRSPSAPQTLNEVLTKINKMTHVKSKKTPSLTITNPATIAASAKMIAEAASKYPILNDKILYDKFRNVTFTNNQKGRIRQVLKDCLQGTSASLLPQVINSKIQSILKSSENLTDSDLRKIRVLFNMLKKSIEDLNKKSSSMIPEVSDDPEKAEDKKKEKKPKKEKNYLGDPNKRYVVFVGNLPLDVTRKQILEHFGMIRDYIKDVRLPQPAADKKSAFAYVEIDNAPVYEMALSMHHTMMGNKRINVLYTTPNKKSKISKSEAKAKSAKLQAMAKKGQLIGSVPQQKKRSHRRAKARAAQKKSEQLIKTTTFA